MGGSGEAVDLRKFLMAILNFGDFRQVRGLFAYRSGARQAVSGGAERADAAANADHKQFPGLFHRIGELRQAGSRNGTFAL